MGNFFSIYLRIPISFNFRFETIVSYNIYQVIGYSCLFSKSFFLLVLFLFYLSLTKVIATRKCFFIVWLVRLVLSSFGLDWLLFGRLSFVFRLLILSGILISPLRFIKLFHTNIVLCFLCKKFFFPFPFLFYTHIPPRLFDKVHLVIYTLKFSKLLVSELVVSINRPCWLWRHKVKIQINYKIYFSKWFCKRNNTIFLFRFRFRFTYRYRYRFFFNINYYTAVWLRKPWIVWLSEV